MKTLQQRQFTDRFTLLFSMSLLIFSSLSAWLIYRHELKVRIQNEREMALAQLQLFEQRLIDELEFTRQDALFLSSNPAYRELLAQPQNPSGPWVAKALEAFLRIRNRYLSFRLLQSDGTEVLFVQGKAHVPKTLIQPIPLPTSAEMANKQLGIEVLTKGDSTSFFFRVITPILATETTPKGWVELRMASAELMQHMTEISEGGRGRLYLRYGNAYIGPTPIDLGNKELQAVQPVQGQLPPGLDDHQKIVLKWPLLESPKLPMNSITGVPLVLEVYPHSSATSTSLAINLLLFALGTTVLLTLILIFLRAKLLTQYQLNSEQQKALELSHDKLEKNKLKLEDSLAALEQSAAQQDGYIRKLERSKANLIEAQSIAKLAYYKRSALDFSTEWSENLSDVLGTSRDLELQDLKSLKLLLHPQDYHYYLDEWNRSLREQSRMDVIYRIYDKKGDLRYIRERADPVLVNGRVKYMQGTLQNVTDSQRVEEELRKAKDKAEKAAMAKAEFLATMSHEIRTPLNAVIGMANLLKITNLDERQKDFVQTIVTSSDALLAVINDILDYSKIESGHFELSPNWVDLNTIVEQSLQVVSLAAIAKKLDIFYQMDRDVQLQVHIDDIRLRQCLINFLNNAVKFTSRGYVKAEVRLLKSKGDVQELRFSVKDTGIGIPPNKIKSIFSAFEQADGSISRHYGGTGLGLSITKKLVETMGGSIGVENREDTGAHFYMDIPIRYRQDPSLLPSAFDALIIADRTEESIALRSLFVKAQIPHQVVAVEAPLPSISGRTRIFMLAQRPHFVQLGKMAAELAKNYKVHLISNLKHKRRSLREVDFITRPFKLSWLIQEAQGSEKAVEKSLDEVPKDLRVLVAEDNVVNQKLVLLLFQQLGLEIDLAADGQQALDMARSKTYDLIFMDIQMPKMDGLESTAFIRSDPKINPKPRIIALTANALSDQRQEYLKAGIDDYLAKPIDFKALVAILKKYARLG